MSPVAVPTTTASGPQLDREPQRLERVLGDARDGGVADAGAGSRRRGRGRARRSRRSAPAARPASPVSSASSCERTNSVRCAAAACWASVAGTRSPSGGRSGSVTVNSAPPSGASPSEISPPCSSTNSRTIARPRPAPAPRERPSPSSPERKRPKTRSRCSGGTPGPESATVSAAAPSPADSAQRTRAADRRVADRVGQQVGDDPAHALDVEARGDRVRDVDRELDLAVGGQRLELLGDGPHGLREVRVDERELRLAVVGLDLLEHVVDLLERAQRGQPDVRRAGARSSSLGLRRAAPARRA